MLDGALTHWKGDPGQVPAKGGQRGAPVSSRQLCGRMGAPPLYSLLFSTAWGNGCLAGWTAAMGDGDAFRGISIITIKFSSSSGQGSIPQLSRWDLSFLLPHFPYSSL